MELPPYAPRSSPRMDSLVRSRLCFAKSLVLTQILCRAVFALLGLLLSFFWTPVGAAHAPERATGWDVGGSLGPSLAGTTVIAIGITHLIVVVPQFRRIGHRQPLPSDVAV